MMTRLVDATIFPTLHGETIVDWNIDGQVDLGDGTEHPFSWSTERTPRLRELLDELNAEVSRLALQDGIGEGEEVEQGGPQGESV
jgi:hypothetical protein